MDGTRTAGTLMRGLCAAACVACLYGCAGTGDIVTPTVSIAAAEASDERADLSLRLENSGNADLRVNSIDYTLDYGSMPVAQDEWRGALVLDSEEAVQLTLPVPFDTAVEQTESDTLTLRGTLAYGARSGQGQTEDADFHVTTPAE